MAIIKAIPTNYGVDATYWRVMKFQDIDVKSQRLCFALYGWVDKEAHDAEKNQIDMVYIDVVGPEFLALAFTVTQDDETVYAALKRVCETHALSLEPFSGGTIDG